jgi:DNA (cytosine-5)-methyltransferase 1
MVDQGHALDGRRQMIALDLFAGAGGAGLGLRWAGFDRVIGVDVQDLGVYYESVVGEFHRMRWEEGLERFAGEADLIWASPPCHRYSRLTQSRPGLAETKPDYIPPVREALIASGKPWIIENVQGAPLRDAVMLCCWSFGYATYRHRFFETSIPIRGKEHLPHVVRGSRSGHYEPGTFISVAGHCDPIAEARRVMAINWMRREELVEAIPPYMSEYIAKEMLYGTGLTAGDGDTASDQKDRRAS